MLVAVDYDDVVQQAQLGHAMPETVILVDG
jgi:hypothetical protein